MGISTSFAADPVMLVRIQQPSIAASRGILSLPGWWPRSIYSFDSDKSEITSFLFILIMGKNLIEGLREEM